MALPVRLLLVLVGLTGSLVLAGCGSGLFGKRYEYEEQLRLRVDGSARLDVNASLQALRALRGLDVGTPDGDVDRSLVEASFEGPGVEVTSVRTSRRNGRRFFHVRLEVEDVRRLSRLAPFSWSRYEFGRRGEVLEFKQVVGPSAGGHDGDAGWTGNEVVAFRMHIPSVVVFHNSPARRVHRGNILEWEQPLAERLKGVPVDLQVNMEPESILYTTLLLFGSTIVLAGLAFGFVIWRVARHGRDEESARPA